MHRYSRALLVAGFFAFGPHLRAVNLVPPASVTVSGIAVQAAPQVRLSATAQLTIDKARARNGWQLTTSVVGGQVQHSGSSFSIPASVRFTAIAGLYGAPITGITISSNGSTITSGPYQGNRSYRASFVAQLNVPAFPRAGAYTGTINFVITEY